MFKPKTKSRLKRTLSGALALAMTASVAAVMPAAAEETAKYPYAVFAADNDAGITINTDNFTLNGSAYTNGVFGATAQYPNINGTCNFDREQNFTKILHEKTTADRLI